MKIHIAILLLLTFVLAACGGQEGISVRDPWARPADRGTNSAVYFTIDNPGPTGDVLLSASSEVAEHIELHMSMMGADNTMSMQLQENVPVPEDSQVAFEPGGLHTMLINLQTDLEAGDSFPLVLNFETSGEVTVEVQVEQR